MSGRGYLIDIILTNKPRSFHKTQGFARRISDFHKVAVTVLRSYFKKLPPKNILYRNVERFEKLTFLRDLDSRLTQGELYNNCQEPYNKLTQIFSEVLNYHAPVKQKVVRCNQDLKNFLMFCQIFLSPQVKRCSIITYKYGMYELPQELPNDLRFRILGN